MKFTQADPKKAQGSK